MRARTTLLLLFAGFCCSTVWSASMLRIACEGDATGAMVIVNGRKMGECPLDMQVQPGDVRVQAIKPRDVEANLVFEQSLYLGDGVVKRIDVLLDKVVPTQEGLRLQAQRRLAAEAAERQKQLAAQRERARQEELRRQQQAEDEARRLQAEREFRALEDDFRRIGIQRDCPDCPELVLVPSGEFAMGSPPDEALREEDEGPVRQVRIKAFAMSKTHVTRGQFAQFVRETGYKATTTCRIWDGGGLFTAPAWRESNWNSWEDPGFPQGDDHPVVCVSWQDAQEYATWLAKKTNKRYRLPSEAELEYAIRGGTKGRWWFEGRPEPICFFENVADATWFEVVSGLGKVGLINQLCRDGYAYTAPVAQFKPNDFGLYDVLGNAAQWAADCYFKSHEGAPADGSARMGAQTVAGPNDLLKLLAGGSARMDAPTCKQRPMRGGIWFDGSANVPSGRAAYRGIMFPGVGTSATSIRVVRDLR